MNAIIAIVGVVVAVGLAGFLIWRLPRPEPSQEKVEADLCSELSFHLADELDRVGFSHRRYVDDAEGERLRRIDRIQFDRVWVAQYAKDETGDNEDSFLVWGGKRHALSSVYAEIDTTTLPYGLSWQKIMSGADDLEITLQLRLFIYGVRRVQIEKYRPWGVAEPFLRIRVVYREAKIQPGIPQFVNFDEAIAEFEQETGRENREKVQRRENLVIRMLAVAMAKFNGFFSTRKMKAEFPDEISKHGVERLAVELEDIGVLEPGAGRTPRRINPDYLNKLNRLKETA